MGSFENFLVRRGERVRRGLMTCLALLLFAAGVVLLLAARKAPEPHSALRVDNVVGMRTVHGLFA